MGLKINLNGSNFVSEKTRNAFERALHQQQEQHQRHQKRVSDNGNGDHPAGQAASPTDVSSPPMPAVAVPQLPQVDYHYIMESLERGLAQSYQHQSETLRVHEQYLNNQAEYSRIFLQLMQQQGSLFTHGQVPSNGGGVPETTHAILESLARSIEQFHAHQSETLGMHNQFLNQQSEYANSFIGLLQEECQALTNPSPNTLPERSRKQSMKASSKGNGNNGDTHHPVNPNHPTEMHIRFSSASSPYPYGDIDPAPSLDRDTSGLPELQKYHPGLSRRNEILPSATVAAPVRPMEDSANGRGMSPVAVTQAVTSADANKQAPPGTDVETLAQSLLDIVSEKTGYPTDILELSMDMEADLGIDSIKRVEILGALEDKHPDLPEVDGDALAELRTLGQVIDYMSAQGAGAVASGTVKKNT
jgi:acyl carrier protein